jgi:hypothetical protein
MNADSKEIALLYLGWLWSGAVRTFSIYTNQEVRALLLSVH